jgi:hypothetical protein
MVMDIYEVELCRRGRWEQQDARFVAATNVDEAAYKVAGEHLHSEGERPSKSGDRAANALHCNGSGNQSTYTPVGQRPTGRVLVFSDDEPTASWSR